MSMPSPATTLKKLPKLNYHPGAYRFLFSALRWTQESLKRGSTEGTGHVSGQELVAGIRQYALDQFGLMTLTVFNTWGLTATDDFGRMVFEMIERGEMSKTDTDRLSDFENLYDFQEAFDRQYVPDLRRAFA